MKRTTKILSLLLSFALIMVMLIGCSQDELTLLNSMLKSSDITSMETKADVTFNIKAQGLSEEAQQSFDEISAMLDGAKCTVDQKVKSNADKTISKSQTDLNLNLGGIESLISIWNDVDLTGTTPKMKEIFKLPAIVTASLSSQCQNKPYIVLDVNELLKDDPQSAAQIKNLMGLSSSLTLKFKDFIKEYAQQFDPGFPMVTKKDDKTVDGQTVSVYNLKLDDAAFKNLLAYAVPNFVQNDKAMSFIKDMVNSIAQIEGDSASAKEINESFEEFKDNMPEFLDEWSKIMSALKDVRILGDKGIDIEFGVNGDGYIVSESGSVDFLLDLKAIADAGENIAALEDSKYKKQESKETGTVKFGFDFNVTNSDINKDIAINMPEVNSQNSCSFTDLMSFTAPSPVIKIKEPVKPKPVKDVTPPSAPAVNKVLRTSTAITGKAEAGSTITVKKGKTVLGKGVTSSKGTFSVTIKPLKTKSTILVTATDKAGNVSKATTVNIK